MYASEQTLVQIDELMHKFRKGLITAEQLVVEFAAINQVNSTVITQEHIDALDSLKELGGILVEAVGEDNANTLRNLHAKLVLAKENRLILSGTMRVIRIEQPDREEEG